MAKLTERYSYGKQGTYELSYFTRILRSEIEDHEEIRCEKPLDWNNGYEYSAIAVAGSDPAEPVWYCVRCTWSNKHKVRIQFRPNIAWTDKENGWS